MAPVSTFAKKLCEAEKQFNMRITAAVLSLTVLFSPAPKIAHSVIVALLIFEMITVGISKGT